MTASFTTRGEPIPDKNGNVGEPALRMWREEHGFECDTEWNNSVGAFRVAVRVWKDADAEWFHDPAEPIAWRESIVRCDGGCDECPAREFSLARTPEQPDAQGDHILFTHPRTWLRDLDPFARTTHPSGHARQMVERGVLHGDHVDLDWVEETDDEFRERIQLDLRARGRERARATALWPGLDLGDAVPLDALWATHEAYLAACAEDQFLARQLETVRPGIFETTYPELRSRRFAPMPLEAPPAAYAYTAQQLSVAAIVGETPAALEFTAEERAAAIRALPPRIKITERTGPARPMNPFAGMPASLEFTAEERDA